MEVTEQTWIHLQTDGQMQRQTEGLDKTNIPQLQCAGGIPQVSNICGTLVGNQIVDHSDVVGASPIGAAPTTSSFST